MNQLELLSECPDCGNELEVIAETTNKQWLKKNKDGIYMPYDNTKSTAYWYHCEECGYDADVRSNRK